MNTVTEVDWVKLAGFNNSISLKIQKRLPIDWKLSIDDIKSEVNETFVKLIKLYIPKVHGRSLTSYCYEYAEKITYARLMKEYSRLKKQICISDAFDEKYNKDDDYTLPFYARYFKHQYGKYDLKIYTTIDKSIEMADMIDILFNIEDELDRQIIQCIAMYDMTYEQIAKKLNISKSSIPYRLKKYAKLLK